MRRPLLVAFIITGCFISTFGAYAIDVTLEQPKELIVRAPADQIEGIAYRHGLEVVRALCADPDAGGNLPYLLQIPGWVDTGVAHRIMEQEKVKVELAQLARLPETSGDASVDPYADVIGELLTWTETATLGSQALWLGYVGQPSAELIEVDEAQIDHVGGTVVAIIDTGVDPEHPALSSWLLPGYDFVADQAGASEWGDITDPSTAAILRQSTVGVLGGEETVLLNQSTVGVLGEDQADALDTSTIPPSFGHGTMVAGVIHRVVPEAEIMPLRAFTGDGYGNLTDVIEAIYYAVEYGADIINMSFTFDGISLELMQAVEYASASGVICTAAVGNEGRHRNWVYPAAMGVVIGTASSTLDDYVSDFSNYGKRISTLAAPGEFVVTTYPGGGWAIATGTSFAAPWVSGSAALMVEKEGMSGYPAVVDLHFVLTALSNAERLSGANKNQVGYGRLSLYDAMLAFSGM
jgi:subtilisin family serine protease